MGRARAASAATVLVLALLTRPGGAAGQDERVGFIDFYGLRSVPADRVRTALGIIEGDVVIENGQRSPQIDEAKNRLGQIPGVRRSHIETVCCDGGRITLFVGIEEAGSPALTFRAAPRGRARLPSEVVRWDEKLDEALVSAIRRGDAGEDRSAGHALAHDPAARAIQEGYIA